MSHRSQLESTTVEIESVLGRGAHAYVALGNRLGADPSLNMRVAVKVAHPTHPEVLPEEIEKRLRDEYRILKEINHPNVVRVIDLTRVDGRVALVMEFVPGSDLESLRRQGPPLPELAALQCVEQLADALSCLHRSGAHHDPSIVHRDVKPENIRLTRGGRVVLLDFGAAGGNIDGREGTTSLQFGTNRYLAPERTSKPNNPSRDVYAAGVVLFELLTGEEMGKTHPERSSALWGMLGRSIHPGIHRLIRDCLSDDRRPRAEQVVARVARLAADAEPPSLREWASIHVVETVHCADLVPSATRGHHDPMWGPEVSRRELAPGTPSTIVLPPRQHGWWLGSLLVVASVALALGIAIASIGRGLQTESDRELEAPATAPRLPVLEPPTDPTPVHPPPAVEVHPARQRTVTVKFLKERGHVSPTRLLSADRRVERKVKEACIVADRRVEVEKDEVEKKDSCKVPAGRYNAFYPYYNGEEMEDTSPLDLRGAGPFWVTCKKEAVDCWVVP